MNHKRKLTAAYKLHPSPAHDVCCSCGADILPKQRSCVDLATHRVQCGRCFRAGVPMELDAHTFGQLRNIRGKCAECGDPIPCRGLFAVPALADAVFRCVKCGNGGQIERDARALLESN